MVEKEFIDCINIEDNLKEITFSNFGNYKHIQIFILCSNSFINYPTINIKELIKGKLSNNVLDLLNKSMMKFEFSVDEIKSLHKKSEIFIANLSFLNKIHINIPSQISISTSYFTDGKKKMLYFGNERKTLLMLFVFHPPL